MKPWQLPGSSIRGADMGRGGADPRAVWPYGVLTFDEAMEQVIDAQRLARRHPDEPQLQSDLAEAKARLAVVHNPGAPMFEIQPVPLDDGGYDEGGAYWGLGDPLYYAGTDCGRWGLYIRAPSAAEAAAAFRDANPDLPRAEYRLAGGE